MGEAQATEIIMALEGTVVNGVIVLDGDPSLPEGARVRVELTEDDFDNVPPRPTTETYEEHLAILRQSIEDAKTGAGGVEARQFLKDLAAKHNLPLQPGE
jgi:hypothetical protein